MTTERWDNAGSDEAATRAKAAVEAYVAAGHGDPDDAVASLVDLAADLLHLADDLYEYDPTTGMGSGRHWLQRLSMLHASAEA